MANYTIRPATVTDIDALVALRQVMFDAMGTGPADDDGWQLGCADYLRQGFAAGDVTAFVADADGMVVGGGVGVIHHRLPGPHNPAGRCGYIMSMATQPAWRGRGVGGGVLDALLGWFEANSVPIVDLHATAEGERVYRSRGFSDLRHAALRRR